MRYRYYIWLTRTGKVARVSLASSTTDLVLTARINGFQGIRVLKTFSQAQMKQAYKFQRGYKAGR